jgi:hypothetical protein
MGTKYLLEDAEGGLGIALRPVRLAETNLGWLVRRGFTSRAF